LDIELDTMPSSDKQAKKAAAAAAALQKKTKSAEETSGELDESVDKSAPQTPKVKSKEKASKDKGSNAAEDHQSTLDKHLRQLTAPDKPADAILEQTLKGFSETLKGLASQEYIESKFKEMVTEEFLSSKLQDLQNEVKTQFKKEIETVYKQVATMKNRIETTEKTVDTLRSKVSDMETAVERISAENTEIKKENERMREQLDEREVKLKVQGEEINSLEQYTRKNTVRIYGIDDRKKAESYIESAMKVVKLVKDKLEIDISTADIDIAHRMGTFTEDANRPIICKFVSRSTKYEVIKARRKLKGSSVVIKEDLSRKNAKLLQDTKALESVSKAWSDDGRIIALLKDDTTKVLINWKTDLSAL